MIRRKQAIFILLPVVVLVTLFFNNQNRIRYQYVTDVDTETGYRCRFTVGDIWERYEPDERSLERDSQNPKMMYFREKVPSNGVEWLKIYILHVPLNEFQSGRTWISLSKFNKPNLFQGLSKPGVYGDLRSGLYSIWASKTLVNGRVMTSLTGVRSTSIPLDSMNLQLETYVNIKPQTPSYDFDASCSSRQFSMMSEEMKAIAASFRLEKDR